MDVVERSAGQDQFLVLACDGIWDVMTNEDVIETVGGYLRELGEGDPLLICEELIEECLAKGSRDNMSALTLILRPGRQLVTSGAPGVMGLRARRAKEAEVKAAQAAKGKAAAGRR
mmetsp:Transcript_16962/g.31211  ORF Transcript_16962/g.31211 Transcript_16962/m.31211 type:complete len:116 (-) Transcript_16962:71-418(-)